MSLSDHTPIMVDTTYSTPNGGQRPFKFELGWLAHEGFADRVKELWNRPSREQTSTQRWANELSSLRRYLKGCTVHISGTYKQQKKELLAIIDKLDKKSELNCLTEN